MTLLAYHGDPAIKRKYLSRLRAHRKADELVAGVGFNQNGKSVQGCAVGCTFDKYDHSRGPVEIGVPAVLIHLEDAIFEGLSRTGTRNEHLAFPESFLSIIRPGADLSMVWPRFALWMLDGPRGPIPAKARNHPTVKAAIDRVSSLYLAWIKTNVKPSACQWDAAGNAAWAAAGGAAGNAAGYKAWRAMRDKLLTLLKDTPRGGEGE